MSNVYTHRELAPFVADRWINAQRHPSLPLTIFNYSQKCQFEKHWTPETLVSRGLIIDDHDEVVAMPFEKFFNAGETPDVQPDGPWRAYEKLDGSLFIVARYESEIVTATRGSFTSPQADLGRALLEAKPTNWVRRGRTYLFELIHPDNRIVVDYGDRAELVLLAVRSNMGWGDIDPDDDDAYAGLKGIPFRINRPMSFWDLSKALTAPESHANREGFVLHFPEADIRLKIKFDDYVRLHRLLTGVSSTTIWELLRDGKSTDDLIGCVPDEFYDWIRKTENDLYAQFEGVKDSAIADFHELTPFVSDRRAFAEQASKLPTKHLLFRLLDNHDIAPLIWKQIKPERAMPFRQEAAA